MAKKKKALKPVVRGFATVSVPKKSVPSEQPQDATENAGGASVAQSFNTPTASVDPPQTDLAALEKGALQAIVETFQDKTEKDIVRSVKAIDQERRFAQTLPMLNLDPVVTDRILELALEGEKIEDRKLGEDNEEKVLGRLGITYGVLRRLGFAEERVEECLRAISGTELEEAFDWLHLHCTEEEIGLSSYSGEVGEPGTPRSSRTLLPTSTAVSTPSQTPQTPRTPVHRQRSLSPHSTRTSPSRTPSRLDANAPVFTPSFARGPSQLREEVQAERLDAREPEITTADTGGTYAGDDPDAEYVRLKLTMDVLRKESGDPGSAERLRLLKTQLDGVKKSYFFREKASEAQYRLEREKLDYEVLKAKLHGLSDPSAVPPASPEAVSSSKHRPPDLKPTETTKNTDIFDDDDDSESPGGLLEILQEIPATETTASGNTVHLRHMEVPKHWSGRTPKVLLQETITKRDKYAVANYACISGPSRVRRASVTICWDGGRTQSWSMDDVGCPDVKQAEQYISTVALHALTFPALDGFALGGTSAASTQTFFRLLPPAIRNLWDELEAKRRESDDATNRAAWAKLRTIARMKLESQYKSTGKSSKAAGGGKEERLTRNIPSSHELSEDQIKAGFEARRASPAYQQMLQERNQLPIARYRAEIVEALEMSQVLVLSGETGCGKSTQVPSFILEDQLSQGKHCKIYCTEPRRISAISLAQRVSRELGDPPGAVGTLSSLVGYSIRLESNTSRNTRLAFVTNGIALRMLESGTGHGGQGTAFDEITHIIIDEVHERSIESDFLLIVLKSLMLERPDLKIVLMSATVDAEKIAEYFGGCPTLHVPGRTFPVDIRYLEDALETTKWWISESSPYASNGFGRFRRAKNRPEWTEDNAAAEDDDREDAIDQDVKLEKRYSANTAATINLLDERQIPYDLVLRLLECICFEDDLLQQHSAAILIFMPGMGEIRRMNDMLTEHKRFGSEDEFIIHALHSTVSSESQGAVFNVPRRGIRKIVIATNIAETGITIPDITCVIDSGKHREMRFDEKRQMSRLVETYVARSNAAQRRGRAGRVQDGLCFHLFTKLRHDTIMADHPLPEMTRLSLSDLALRIKTMKVNLGSTIEDVLTRALDPPSTTNIRRAVSVLVEVRALTQAEDITSLGRLLSKLPTDVHLGKFLLIATTFRCLDPALTIAATLSSKSPFLVPFGSEDAADIAKSRFKAKSSDFLTIHNAFGGWRKASADGVDSARSYCHKNFLSYQNLQAIEELRQQFLGYLIDSSFIHVEREYIRELSRTRWGRSRARFMPVPPEYDSNSGNHFLLHAALAAGLYPKILAVDPIDRKVMKTVSNGQACQFHPSSVNSRGFLDLRGNHMVYFTLMHSKKLYAWETGPVEDLALILLCGECEFRLISNSAFIDRKIKFRVPGRVNVALKYLRHHLATILGNQVRGKPLSESQLLWDELAMTVLGKTKLITGEEDGQGGIGQIIVV